MRWIKTKKKKKCNTTWHRWFAWYPVPLVAIEDWAKNGAESAKYGPWVWWEWVERKHYRTSMWWYRDVQKESSQ